MSNILYAVEIAVALGLIIFVHELGHFLAAKAFGVWVRRFAIGFGPALVKWKRGETEYSLRAFPLGGFVEPMGDHPDSEGGDNPRALWRLPAWQRATVFAAGVTMNAFLALVLFAVAPLVGKQVIVPIVGAVMPGSPAEKVGIKAGDRIVSIDGEPVESFEDLRMTVNLADAGTPFDLRIERAAEGSDTPTLLAVTVANAAGPDAPGIGISPEAEPVIAAMDAAALLCQAGLKKGDRILEVNREPVKTWRGLDKALADAPAGPLVLRIERSGKQRDLRVVPADLKVYDYGMKWPTQVVSVQRDMPAKEAGIEPGDRIAAIEGKPWPSSKTIIETVGAVDAGDTVRITLWRKGQLLDVLSRTARMPGEDRPRISVSMGHALGGAVQVGVVDPGGPADEAHLRPGDIIHDAGKAADREANTVHDWETLSKILREAGDAPVLLRVQRGSSLMTTTLTPKPVPQDSLTLVGAAGTPVFIPLPRISNPLRAIRLGFRRAWLWFQRVYKTLVQLLRGEVGTGALGGPVLIVQASFGIATRGIGTFIDFWGILSVCLAVFNFLPIPPFDGGHVLFVIIEKIKGSPVGLKVRTWIWGAGWAAVLALFVLITWQDILRLL